MRERLLRAAPHSNPSPPHALPQDFRLSVAVGAVDEHAAVGNAVPLLKPAQVREVRDAPVVHEPQFAPGAKLAHEKLQVILLHVHRQDPRHPPFVRLHRRPEFPALILAAELHYVVGVRSLAQHQPRLAKCFAHEGFECFKVAVFGLLLGRDELANDVIPLHPQRIERVPSKRLRARLWRRVSVEAFQGLKQLELLHLLKLSRALLALVAHRFPKLCPVPFARWPRRVVRVPNETALLPRLWK